MAAAVAGLALAVLAFGFALAGGAAADEPARRIVALGGAVTEILYGLGAEGEIVALDTTSVHPPQALATKPNVGYLRQLSAEGILSARPTLVLAIDGAGPPDALALVEAAGVGVTHVPDEPDAAGVLGRIAAVAHAVGREAAGQALAETTRRDFARLAAARTRIARPLRALFVLSVQNGRVLVGGPKTTADGMFALAGLANAASGFEGYKPMSDEALIAAQPDAIVMMETGPGGRPSADLLDAPAFAQTPAGRARRLVVMNGQYLLGFGPRTPSAARDLMRILYPDVPAE